MSLVKQKHTGDRRKGGGRYSFALPNRGANYSAEGAGGNNRKERRNRALKITLVVALLISLYLGLNKFARQIPEHDGHDGLSDLADQSIGFAQRLPRGRKMLLFLFIGIVAVLFGRNKILTKVVESSKSSEPEGLVDIGEPDTPPIFNRNKKPLSTRANLLLAIGMATVMILSTTFGCLVYHCDPVFNPRRVTVQTPTNPGVGVTVPVPAGMSPAATAALQIAQQYVEIPMHTSSPLEPDGFTFIYGPLRISRAAFELLVDALTHALY